MRVLSAGLMTSEMLLAGLWLVYGQTGQPTTTPPAVRSVYSTPGGASLGPQHNTTNNLTGIIPTYENKQSNRLKYYSTKHCQEIIHRIYTKSKNTLSYRNLQPIIIDNSVIVIVIRIYPTFLCILVINSSISFILSKKDEKPAVQGLGSSSRRWQSEDVYQTVR